MPFQLPEGDGCLFWERVAGTRDDWAVIDADDATVAFINPRQYEEGQAVVIPRRHAPTIVDLTEEEAAALMRSARRLARAMVRAFAPDGLTFYQNNGVVSGQEVPHFHLHVVPRAEREERFRRGAAPMKRQTEIAERLRLRLIS